MLWFLFDQKNSSSLWLFQIRDYLLLFKIHFEDNSRNDCHSVFVSLSYVSCVYAQTLNMKKRKMWKVKKTERATCRVECYLSTYRLRCFDDENNLFIGFVWNRETSDVFSSSSLLSLVNSISIEWFWRASIWIISRILLKP